MIHSKFFLVTAITLGVWGSATAERLPAFSWETIPSYIHIRKDTAFTPEEIEYLASFPLITLEKMTGNNTYGSTEEGTAMAAGAIKAINADAKVLYYRNVIVHYGSYAANEALEDIPDAFLRGKSGKDKLVRGKVEAYDLSNVKLRDWWLGNAKEVCDDPNVDGVFLDGVVKVLEPGYLKRDIGAEKKKAVENGYHRMMDDLRKVLEPEKLMVSNALRARFPDSGLGGMKVVDGSYIEAFEVTVGKMAKKDYVAKGMEAFQTAARGGALIAFTAGLGKEGGINQGNKDRTDEYRQGLGSDGEIQARFTYLLAMFLVCAEEHSYFNAHDSYDAKQSELWLKRPAECERPLGEPKGPAVKDGYVYTREFAHASVRVDIEKEVGEIVWK
ncbi:MAG: putative glycoside hydrolase [Luteolibacter sp.]